MYSQYLQDQIETLGVVAEVPADSISLLNDAMACYLGILGRAIDAQCDPQGDLLTISVRMLLLDDAVMKMDQSDLTDRIHYLIGMVFEQTGELIARIKFRTGESSDLVPPMNNDHWYRLVLSLLHYLAGGHRVHALSVMRQLDHFDTRLQPSEISNDYHDATRIVHQLFSGQTEDVGLQSDSRWSQLVQQSRPPQNSQEKRIQRLSRRIVERRQNMLSELGQGNEHGWLGNHAVTNEPSAVAFWSSYLRRLQQRGITTFTPDQRGAGFHTWLGSDHNMVVALPTGAGKTIVGELLTALTLTQGRHVVWLVPLRSLVRQIRRELITAFSGTGVSVTDLPTTEDFVPLFASDALGTRSISICTPEKLSALLRANPSAVADVGLVVFDEAQLLVQRDARATTAETVLRQISRAAPSCRFVLMTAFTNEVEVMRTFLDRLVQNSGSCLEMVSEARPTRRIYGILTDEPNRQDSTSSPALLLYPAGLQSEIGTTHRPFRITLADVRSRARQMAPLTLCEHLVKRTTSAGLRTVLFVNRKDSTETRASDLAAHAPIKRSENELTLFERARLRLELGRASILEDTVPGGIAPYNAGLSALEQHLIEKLVKSGRIRTVVATTGLAQGVNLPFDISIVSFLARNSPHNNRREPLQPAEIQNMLGRAGRAGYVSDGICLIAVSSNRNNSVEILDQQRRNFFSVQSPSSENIGFLRLLRSAMAVGIDQPDWLFELTEPNFSEFQAVVSFTMQAIENETDFTSAILSRFSDFPSLQSITSQELLNATRAFSELANNVIGVCGGDRILLEAVRQTGMPIEILQYFLLQLRTSFDPHQLNHDEKLIWTDTMVEHAVASVATRAWYRNLMDGDRLNLGAIMSVVRSWRSGQTIAEIEAQWRENGVGYQERTQHIELGSFLAHDLSIWAQFWGAISVCHELLSEADGTAVDDTISSLQVFVREGVSSIQELGWLQAFDHLDRVLAHRLAANSVVPPNYQAIQSFVSQQLAMWSREPIFLPSALSEEERLALQAVITDLYGANN